VPAHPPRGSPTPLQRLARTSRRPTPLWILSHLGGVGSFGDSLVASGRRAGAWRQGSVPPAIESARGARRPPQLQRLGETIPTCTSPPRRSRRRCSVYAVRWRRDASVRFRRPRDGLRAYMARARHLEPASQASVANPFRASDWRLVRGRTIGTLATRNLAKVSRTRRLGGVRQRPARRWISGLRSACLPEARSRPRLLPLRFATVGGRRTALRHQPPTGRGARSFRPAFEGQFSRRSDARINGTSSPVGNIVRETGQVYRVLLRTFGVLSRRVRPPRLPPSVGAQHRRAGMALDHLFFFPRVRRVRAHRPSCCLGIPAPARPSCIASSPTRAYDRGWICS